MAHLSEVVRLSLKLELLIRRGLCGTAQGAWGGSQNSEGLRRGVRHKGGDLSWFVCQGFDETTECQIDFSLMIPAVFAS